MPPSEETDREPAAQQAGRRWYSSALARLWPFGLGLLGAVVGLFIYAALDSGPDAVTNEEIQNAVAEAVASAPDPAAASAEVYQAILPSLVYVIADGPAGNRLGSGVIVNQDGSVLTAHHVVVDAESIRLVFADGTEGAARIADADPENDLAVLQPDAAPEVIVPAVLAGAGGVHVGDETFAVGNPLGLVASISAGVISGLNRSIPVGTSGDRLDGLIQFDAAVNPGSSGGPLLNREGQVIGIVTALANPTNDNSFTGIGFAVSLDSAAAGGGGPPQ